MFDKSSLEARRDRSSLRIFHKINCGAVSVEKDKYLIPAHSLKVTRSSHSDKYCSHTVTRFSSLNTRPEYGVVVCPCLKLDGSDLKTYLLMRW